MVPSHLNLLSHAADACLLVIPSKWRACSQARCGFSLKCGAHHECSGDAVNKTEWDMVMLSGLVNFIRSPAYNQSLLQKCGLQSLFAGGEWRWREILLPLPSPLSSPSVKTWPAGYKTTWNSILDCWMFRHMRMPNQLTYKGKKTRCTHQLKVRLYHIEIENWQCFKWILLTFWSLRCKFIKKRHCSYHKLNSKVKMC